MKLLWLIGMVGLVGIAAGAFYAASSPTFWISIVGALVTAIAPSLPAIKNNPALEKLRRQKRWK